MFPAFPRGPPSPIANELENEEGPPLMRGLQNFLRSLAVDRHQIKNAKRAKSLCALFYANLKDREQPPGLTSLYQSGHWLDFSDFFLLLRHFCSRVDFLPRRYPPD